MKRSLLALSIALAVSGCATTSTFSTTPLNKETPMMSSSSMTPLLKCVADNVIKAHQESGAYSAQNPEGIQRLLVVVERDQFADGTVRREAAYDGPLADDNQSQMKAILNRWIPSYILTLPAREVPVLRRNGVKGSAISRFGNLEADAYMALAKQYNVDNVVYFSGSFTKLDNETPLLDKGWGSHGKIDGDLGLAFSKGRATRESVVGLSVSLGHVGTNTVISSTMIEARMHKQSNEVKLSMVPGDANVALSKKVIVSEGVQGTQQMLLEAAALWFVGLAYPNDAGLAACLNSDRNPLDLLSSYERWKAASKRVQIAELQTLLTTKGMLTGEYTSGVMDDVTKEAIRAYDLKHGLFHTPHIEGNLDSLYVHLIALAVAPE